MPSFDAKVSEITVPTKASVIATFSDAKKYGIDRGSPTLRRMSSLLAPSERRTSSSSGSTVASPVDRKSTRLNSSHGYISYAVFCLKKKKKKIKKLWTEKKKKIIKS